jgi:uncharacterized phage protein gp47/JayE
MPYSRPTLDDLTSLAAADIASALPGTDPILRFSNLQILGRVLAGMTHLQFGYLDWIGTQAVPFTATGEYLEAWGALKGVLRIQATQATGTVRFTGTNGSTLPAGTPLTRGDGKTYTTTASGTVSGGSVTVAAIADADPEGLTGAWGNCADGTAMVLSQAVAGINSSGVAATDFTGGADLETDSALRSRMLLAYQNPAHGGSAADYIGWALAVPGVTRCWVVGGAFGPGSVALYPMLDIAHASNGGFPVGTDGCATGETRDTTATGDQLAVANAIFDLQPVTALVYVVAPTAYTVNFTISGLSTADASVKSAVAAAIRRVFTTKGTITSTTTRINLSSIIAAIGDVDGTEGFLVTSPASNITVPQGKLPKLGVITWAA